MVQAFFFLDQRAKAVIRECAERNKQNDTEYASLQKAMKRRLRITVEEHWRKVHDCLRLVEEKEHDRIEKEIKLVLSPSSSTSNSDSNSNNNASNAIIPKIETSNNAITTTTTTTTTITTKSKPSSPYA